MKTHPHIDLIKKYSRAAQSVGLSHEEKSAMKARILENMKSSSTSASVPVSPEHRSAKILSRSFFPASWSWNLASSKRYVVAPALLLVVIGGGTSFAAESSLPGDLLYPVKINVNESVLSALSITAVGQAKWAVDRVNRRLEELNQLGTTTNATFASEVKAESATAQTKIAALKTADPSDAAALSTKLNTVLQHIPFFNIFATSTVSTSVAATSTSATSTPTIPTRKAIHVVAPISAPASSTTTSAGLNVTLHASSTVDTSDVWIKPANTSISPIIPAVVVPKAPAAVIIVNGQTAGASSDGSNVGGSVVSSITGTLGL